jgi:hypothetical protein
MPGRAGKYQRPGRQLDQRQVNSGTVRDASYHPQITITFGHEKRDKVAVDFDGALAALGFRTLDLQSVFYGFFYRSLDPQRLSGRVKIFPTQRQNFTAPGASECRYGDDREQHRFFEAVNERP